MYIYIYIYVYIHVFIHVYVCDILGEILGASSRVTTSLDLDLAFGAVDSNVDLACTSILSPLSPLPPPIASPPHSAAAGEPM